jgi:hypothetical protein
MIDPHEVKQIANNNQWRFVKGNKPLVLEFKRLAWRVIVDCERSRVDTILKHPRLGWTRLTRKNIDAKLLTHIFHYPRVHTENGVHIRKFNKSPKINLKRS